MNTLCYQPFMSLLLMGGLQQGAEVVGWKENMLLIYTKARMSRSAIMANGTLLDASLSDISPLSSSLFLISSKKKVHRVVLFPAPK